ncbi:MAG TPA: ROK family protein [Solirubrobacteraceae bacterium]|jgi:glucokinase|nr:ROK family protein [Solirubrobacteraceae bacterium]
MSQVIGIDVGGTKVAATLLGPDGMGGHTQQPTRLDSGEALIDQLVNIVGETAGGQSYDAVGIGVPSIVRFETGEIAASTNIPLEGVALREVLGERLGTQVFVDNDATVAALAEAYDEELNMVSRNLVIITVGTGIGGGVVIDGQIFRGASGGAGEVGMTLIGLACDPDMQAATDHFPQPGSLEALASGHALDRFAQAAAAQHPESALGRLAAAGQNVLAADAVVAARAGDADAAAAVRRWAHALGVGIANAVNTFDPDEVVIGGGGAAAGELLLDQAAEFAAGYVHPGLKGRATVRLARWGAPAGVLGAALLAAHELERVPA